MNDDFSFYDALEARDPALREAALMAALPLQVAHAQKNAPAFARLLVGIDPASVNTRGALAQLPVTRKHELLEQQQAARAARRDIGIGSGTSERSGTHIHTAAGSDVFGGFSPLDWGAAMPRVFASPGGLFEPEGRSPDYWRMARALFASGFRAGDLLHNSFSYHLVPAGAMMETGAHALGCTVFPGGTGQTELQLDAMEALRPTGYVGTPSFLKLLLEKAAQRGTALPHLRRAMVSGEAFPPSLGDWVRSHGVEAYQCYASADLGLIAYETSARDGMVIDEGVIVEIVQPGTSQPVANDGDVGELVVTTLTPGYPLIRFGTGDLSAVLPGACPTGRSNTRIRGWMGRADQTTKVRGMFVHPGQVAAIGQRFAQLGRLRLVVSGEMADDRMLLLAECGAPDASLAAAVEAAIRDITKLRGEVRLEAPGSLPNDGKTIEDARSYR